MSGIKNFTRHSREGGNPVSNSNLIDFWIPAFAGMTVFEKISVFFAEKFQFLIAPF